MLQRPGHFLTHMGLWVGLPVLLWYTTSAPFGWIALWIAALLMVMGIRGKKALIFNLAWVFVLVGGAELVLWLGAPDVGQVVPANYQRVFSAPHEVLGYAPTAERSGTARYEREGRTLFDVVYTTGANGWRIAPPAPEPPAPSSCICFGCSFMFGWGVANEETLPYRLEQELSGRQRVYNLAFMGWGPHQMLAALESGIVKETVEEPPRAAIFLTSIGHAGRAAGRRGWDKRGPRYTLNETGGVTQVGTFADLPHETYWERRKRKFLAKSWVLKAIASKSPEHVEAEDIRLWVAITKQARDHIEATWPGCEFHVLLWDGSSEADLAFLERAQAEKLRVHRVSKILPGFAEDALPWSVDRFDPHPNAKAHAALAHYMAQQIGVE